MEKAGYRNYRTTGEAALPLLFDSEATSFREVSLLLSSLTTAQGEIHLDRGFYLH